MNHVLEDILSYLGCSEWDEEDIMHYGMPRRSGRYPYGSGENPYQHSRDFLGRIEELKKNGWEETPENIMKEFGLSTTKYRIEKKICKDERRLDMVATAKSLKADGLGATEGWSVILLNSGKYLEPYKIGRPIDTLNVKIIDENTGKEVTKGNKGLLCISGPSVMLEYYENEIETSKVMFKDKEGNTWVNTGDIVRETESGNYEYVGRKKRNFVSGIENIYPEQIEDLLTTLPEINEVVVTCVPNGLVQYLPIYHISLNNSDIDLTTLEKKINSLVEKKLGVNWLPCKIDYSFTFLKRMTNSKLDVTYYQSIDNEEYQKNHNSYDNSVNVRLRKM